MRMPPVGWAPRAPVLALALAAALPQPGRAQQVDLLPSAASRCLQPPAEQRGVPDYPFAAWKNGEKGRVKVELEITAPDRRPRVQVQVQERDGADSMVEAVQAHVRQWRVPCLTEAEQIAVRRGRPPTAGGDLRSPGCPSAGRRG